MLDNIFQAFNNIAEKLNEFPNSVKNTIAEFNKFPDSVKKANIFLAASWLWLYITLWYTNMNLLRYIIGGLLICYFVLKIKNWARVLSILANLFIIFQFLPVSVELFNRGILDVGIILGVNILLSSISIYYLTIRETADFFKQHNKKDEKPASADQNSQN